MFCFNISIKISKLLIYSKKSKFNYLILTFLSFSILRFRYNTIPTKKKKRHFEDSGWDAYKSSSENATISDNEDNIDIGTQFH